MMFYELEKRCKQRRVRKLLYVILILLVFFAGILFSSKKEVKTVKQVNKEMSLKAEDENVFSLNKTDSKNEIKNQENENNKQINDKKKPLLTPIIPSIKKPKKVENKIKNIETNKPQTSIVEVDALPSYEECIKLAKKYLREKNYDLALKWAKNANIQNKTLPDPWIITAKVLFYRGKKEKAIEILKIYLKFRKDKRIENLLKKFEDEKNS